AVSGEVWHRPRKDPRLSILTRIRSPHAPEPETADEPAHAAGEPGRTRLRRIAAAVLTGLAALALFAALVVPSQLTGINAWAVLRIPVEALVGIAVLLVVPARARRVLVIGGGLLLGVLTLIKLVDVGFYAVLNRPFDLVLDWILFGDAYDWLAASFGGAGAIVALVLVILLVATIPVLLMLAVRRLTRIAVRRRTPVLRTAAV